MQAIIRSVLKSLRGGSEKASDKLFSYKRHERHPSSQAGSSAGSSASRKGSSVATSVKSFAE